MRLNVGRGMWLRGRLNNELEAEDLDDNLEVEVKFEDDGKKIGQEAGDLLDEALQDTTNELEDDTEQVTEQGADLGHERKDLSLDGSGNEAEDGVEDANDNPEDRRNQSSEALKVQGKLENTIEQAFNVFDGTFKECQDLLEEGGHNLKGGVDNLEQFDFLQNRVEITKKVIEDGFQCLLGLPLKNIDFKIDIGINETVVPLENVDLDISVHSDETAVPLKNIDISLDTDTNETAVPLSNFGINGGVDIEGEVIWDGGSGGEEAKSQGGESGESEETHCR